MKKHAEAPSQMPDLSGLSAAEVRELVAGLQQQVAAQQTALQQRNLYIQGIRI
ncbi:hypothetical protein K7H09_23945 [Halomonas sp. IOP_14]|uniref:hypothetical protein n=1 Tax=Halomonas sp. IOP_14 TaxID=2873295 RepID=UPI001E373A0C|nr:hypothetical protein [Halomonas sp. IOP_14]MCD1589057.1 hypothetical protein [Halomonas sp. IOP_14]